MLNDDKLVSKPRRNKSVSPDSNIGNMCCWESGKTGHFQRNSDLVSSDEEGRKVKFIPQRQSNEGVSGPEAAVQVSVNYIYSIKYSVDTKFERVNLKGAGTSQIMEKKLIKGQRIFIGSKS